MPSLETSSFVSDALLFVLVIECHSFTQAGERLGISKSIVSKRIRRLEAHLKLQLLVRSTRRLALTEVGKKLYEKFKLIKAEIEGVESLLGYYQGNPSGLVKLHSPVSLGEKYLAPLVQQFTEQFPKVEVKLYLGRQFEHLIESGMDLSVKIGPLEDSNLYAKKITACRMIACASPAYCERYGYPMHPQDLSAHNCLRYHSPSKGNDWLFKIDGGYQSVRVGGNFSASSANSLEAAAVAGQGIVMLPEYVVLDRLKSGELVRVLSEFCSSFVNISLLYAERKHMAPKVRVLLDFLERELTQQFGG